MENSIIFLTKFYELVTKAFVMIWIFLILQWTDILLSTLDRYMFSLYNSLKRFIYRDVEELANYFYTSPPPPPSSPCVVVGGWSWFLAGLSELCHWSSVSARQSVSLSLLVVVRLPYKKPSRAPSLQSLHSSSSCRGWTQTNTVLIVSTWSSW